MKTHTKVFLCLVMALSALLILAGCTGNTGDTETSNVGNDTTAMVDTTPSMGTETDGESDTDAETDTETEAITLFVCDTCTFDGWVITKNPTCTAEGKQQRTCTVCGSIEYDTLPAAEHAWGEYVLVKSPSVEHEGAEERVCDDCGAKDLRPIDKLTAITSFADLKVCLENGDSTVLLTTDITLTETIYVTGDTTLYVKEDHALTRSPEFLGDLFVIGEDAEGNNTILSDSQAKLTFKTENGATLTIDGNKDAITEAVFGTVFWLTNSAELNIYDGVTVQNCRKLANQRTYDNDAFTTPDKVGGAVAIVENGVLNMYGGLLTGNEVNLKNSANTPEEERVEGYDMSSWGGVIFNRATFNMYGGSINGNQASRGAVVCNYRSCYFYGGTLENNQASQYGGVLYQPSSQYGSAYFGDLNSEDPSEIAVRVKGNTSALSGGAVFAAHQSSVLVYGNTLFENNQSLDGNGGAINVAGELTVQYAHFKNNQASSKGGAIYAYYSEPDLEVRTVSLNGGLFEGNRAPRGGALCLGAGDGMTTGAVVTVGNVTFRDNVAFMATEGTAYGRGGAIYVTGVSTLTVSGEAQFISNVAEDNGGAIYMTDHSTVTMAGTDAEHPVVFDGNTAADDGGAIYLYDGASFTATDISIVRNSTDSTEYGGGAIFMTADSSAAFHGTVLFDSNTTPEKGGVVFAGGESTLTFSDVDSVTFINNQSANHGGVFFITGSARVILEGSKLDEAKTITVSDDLSVVVGTNIAFVGNTATSSGGAIYLYTGASMEANDVTFAYNTATDGNGGALYLSKAEDTEGETPNPTSSATLTDLILTGNAAGGNGGAMYVYRGSVATVSGTLTMSDNTAGGNGGAVYCSGSGGSSAIIDGDEAATLVLTDNTATENGGGMYVTSGATVDVDALTATGNTATENGGAVALMSKASTFKVGTLTATENAAAKGGALYAEKLTATVSTLTVRNNNATEGGGALYVTEAATLNVGTLEATDNTAGGNGGAMYIYTDAVVNIGTLTATGNSTAEGKFGGVIYASGPSTTVIDNVQATGNSAGQGGFLYLTKSGSAFTVKAGSIADNTAPDGGAAIWINTKKVKLYVEQDVDTPIFDEAELESKDGHTVNDYEAA